ncbi:peptidase family M28 [Aspergillus luchuensis]|uniref:Peptidase family M28 n=1 Tax=Aspergillus kawachii TaxID=1069201 RepID=A0A146EYF1_ASPKA|nr:peptidase family M28 [Aspergillus luchuensis]
MPRNYASLADQSVFPSISDLPGDYTCPETGGGVFGCLLVEIVSIERITRLVLRTFDRADSPVTVAFYTGDRGRSIENDPKLKPGNTMAILFPRRHLFLDGTVGVRQEHYGYFKDCQKAGWEEKEHKKMCKIIADRDFRTLVTITGRTDPVAEISFQMLRDAYERGLRAL